MDIRNILTEPPVVEGGKYLEKIYDLQRDLMAGYIGKIEKSLPNYPISLNSEKGQLVLKDFSARVIEETAEGYESTSAALQILESHGMNLDALSLEEFDMVVNHLQNSNEEQADAFAFFVELMLYANIQFDDIYSYVATKMVNGLRVEDLTLGHLFEIGALEYVKREWVEEGHNLFPSISEEMLKAHNLQPKKVFGYIPGFLRISSSQHELEDHMLWKVAYHLNLGRNYLKNKTWKQTQELTDGLRYQSEVVKAFVAYCGYLQVMGFKPETFYVLFYKKHMVNKFRQKSGY